MRLRFAATVAVLSLLLSGCSTDVSHPKIALDDGYPKEFSSYYQQQVSFEGCGQNLYCANIKVPMDWNEPSSPAIEIATIYRKADAEPKGFILFNPGGPGSSGFDWVENSSDYLGTEKLRKNFNLVGFDPRGVGRSSSVKCLENSGYDEFLYGESGYPLGSEEDIQITRDVISDFASKCLENTGELLGYVDTVSAAKDMDVIRAVLGESKLNYLGYSYGTFLGTTYATLFPERVGRFVLDGAIDPYVSEEEQTRLQLTAFENSLKAFLARCDEFGDCPFTGNIENDLAKIKTLFLSIENRPLPTSSGRELTIWAAVTGLIMPLYSEDYWPALSKAFAEAFKGKGDTFLDLADYYNDRGEDGKYTTNLIAANFAVSCLDSRSDSSAVAMAEENERVIAAAPTIGRYWQFGALRCENWPFPKAQRPESYAAEGAETILVIGTTGDPATPYSQAVSLANDVLANAFLVSYEGEGHTIYGQGVECVDDAVDNFFVSGELPASDPRC